MCNKIKDNNKKNKNNLQYVKLKNQQAFNLYFQKVPKTISAVNGQA